MQVTYLQNRIQPRLRRTGRTLLLLAALLALLAGCALAAETDGYVLQLRDGAALPTALENELDTKADTVREDAGVYKTDDPTIIQKLADAGVLDCAEPNYVFTLDAEPDDTLYAGGKQWDLAMLGMSYAWAKNVTGKGAVIGIVDSGLNSAHEDLAGANIRAGYNYCNSASTDTTIDRGDTSDAVGHGTFVTGIIAAATGNGKGVAGIAPGAAIVPLRAFASQNADIADIVAAIYGGVNDYGCTILNMSFGDTSSSDVLKKAIEYAQSRDVICVAAVGNDHLTKADALMYPAAYDGVIGVGAVQSDKTVADFSAQNASVFITAPGYALWGLSLTNDAANGAYRTGNGTSYAAPEVTAAIALLQELHPGLTLDETRALLEGCVEDLGAAGRDDVYGWGLLSVQKLLTELTGDSAVLAEVNDSTFVCASWTGLQANESLLCVCAAYDEKGRMLSVSTATGAADSSGGYSLLTKKEMTSADHWKIYLLDASTGAPLRTVSELKAPTA